MKTKMKNWLLGFGLISLSLIVGIMILGRHSQKSTDVPPRANVDTSILDNYTGYYQWNDDDLVTIVTRSGDQLFEQYPFKSKVEMYLQDTMHYRLLGDKHEMRFELDPNGRAQGLTFDIDGVTFIAPRIDAARGRELFAAQYNKQRDQIQTAGSDVMLRRIVNGLISGRPEYQLFSDALVKQQQVDFQSMHDRLSFFGAVHETKFLGVGEENDDIFLITQDNAYTRWHINLGQDGTVKLLQYETVMPHRVPM